MSVTEGSNGGGDPTDFTSPYNPPDTPTSFDASTYFGDQSGSDNRPDQQQSDPTDFTHSAAAYDNASDNTYGDTNNRKSYSSDTTDFTQSSDQTPSQSFEAKDTTPPTIADNPDLGTNNQGPDTTQAKDPTDFSSMASENRGERSAAITNETNFGYTPGTNVPQDELDTTGQAASDFYSNPNDQTAQAYRDRLAVQSDDQSNLNQAAGTAAQAMQDNIAAAYPSDLGNLEQAAQQAPTPFSDFNDAMNSGASSFTTPSGQSVTRVDDGSGYSTWSIAGADNPQNVLYNDNGNWRAVSRDEATALQQGGATPDKFTSVTNAPSIAGQAMQSVGETPQSSDFMDRLKQAGLMIGGAGVIGVGGAAAAETLANGGIIGLSQYTPQLLGAAYITKGMGDTVGTSLGGIPGAVANATQNIPVIGEMTRQIASIPIPQLYQNPLANIEQVANTVLHDPTALLNPPAALAGAVFTNALANAPTKDPMGVVRGLYTTEDPVRYAEQQGLQRAGLEYLLTSTVQLHDPQNGLGTFLSVTNPVDRFHQVFESELAQTNNPTLAAQNAYTRTTNAVAEFLHQYDLLNPLWFAVDAPGLQTLIGDVVGNTARAGARGLDLLIPGFSEGIAQPTRDFFLGLSTKSGAELAARGYGDVLGTMTGRLPTAPDALAELYRVGMEYRLDPAAGARAAEQYALNYGGNRAGTLSMANRLVSGAEERYLTRTAPDTFQAALGTARIVPGKPLVQVPFEQYMNQVIADYAGRNFTFDELKAAQDAARLFRVTDGPTIEGLTALRSAQRDLLAATYRQAGLNLRAIENPGISQQFIRFGADTLRTLFLLPGAPALAVKKIIDEAVRSSTQGVFAVRPADLQIVRTGARFLEGSGSDVLRGIGTRIENASTIRQYMERGIPVGRELLRTPESSRMALSPFRITDKVLDSLVSSPTQHVRLNAAYRELQNWDRLKPDMARNFAENIGRAFDPLQVDRQALMQEAYARALQARSPRDFVDLAQEYRARGGRILNEPAAPAATGQSRFTAAPPAAPGTRVEENIAATGGPRGLPGQVQLGEAIPPAGVPDVTAARTRGPATVQELEQNRVAAARNYVATNVPTPTDKQANAIRELMGIRPQDFGTPAEYRTAVTERLARDYPRPAATAPLDIAAGDGGAGYLSRQQRAIRDDVNAMGGFGNGRTLNRYESMKGAPRSAAQERMDVAARIQRDAMDEHLTNAGTLDGYLDRLRANRNLDEVRAAGVGINTEIGNAEKYLAAAKDPADIARASHDLAEFTRARREIATLRQELQPGYTSHAFDEPTFGPATKLPASGQIFNDPMATRLWYDRINAAYPNSPDLMTANTGAGWKLHLNTPEDLANPNTRAIAEYLSDRGVPFKVGKGGESVDGKGMTIYVGGKDEARAVAQDLETKFGNRIGPPVGDVLHTNQPFTPHVTGRFDTSNDAQFAQYGRNGTPLPKENDQLVRQNMIGWAKTPPEIIDRFYANGDAAAAAKYGDLYTGRGVAAETPVNPREATVNRVRERLGQAGVNEPVTPNPPRVPGRDAYFTPVQPEAEDIELGRAAQAARGNPVVDFTGRTFYHGTGEPFLDAANLVSDATDPFGLFGPGTYLTDNPEIARQYAATRARQSAKDVLYRTGKGVPETPTVYETRLGNARNVLDVEQPAPQNVREIFARSPYPDVQARAQDPAATTQDLYGALKRAAGRDEYGNAFADINRDLRAAGYDGLTHTGGQRVGNVQHQVFIGLEPQSGQQVIREMRPYAPAADPTDFTTPPVQPPGPPLQLGAGERATPLQLGAGPRTTNFIVDANGRAIPGIPLGAPVDQRAIAGAFSRAADVAQVQSGQFGAAQTAAAQAGIARGNRIIGNFAEQTPFGELVTQGSINGRQVFAPLVPFAPFHIHTTQFWSQYFLQHPAVPFAIARALGGANFDQYGGIQAGNRYVSGLLELSTAAKLVEWARNMYAYARDAIANPNGNNPLQTAAKIGAYGLAGNGAFLQSFPYIGGTANALVQSTTNPMMNAKGQVDPREVQKERGALSAFTGAANLLTGEQLPRGWVQGVTDSGQWLTNQMERGVYAGVNALGGHANLKQYTDNTAFAYWLGDYAQKNGLDAKFVQKAVYSPTTDNEVAFGQQLRAAFNRQQDMNALQKFSPVRATEQGTAKGIFPPTQFNDNSQSFLDARNFAGMGGRDAGIRLPANEGGYYMETPQRAAYTTADNQLKLSPSLETAPTADYARAFLQQNGYMPPASASLRDNAGTSAQFDARQQGLTNAIAGNASRFGAGLPQDQRTQLLNAEGTELAPGFTVNDLINQPGNVRSILKEYEQAKANGASQDQLKAILARADWAQQQDLAQFPGTKSYFDFQNAQRGYTPGEPKGYAGWSQNQKDAWDAFNDLRNTPEYKEHSTLSAQAHDIAAKKGTKEYTEWWRTNGDRLNQLDNVVNGAEQSIVDRYGINPRELANTVATDAGKAPTYSSTEIGTQKPVSSSSSGSAGSSRTSSSSRSPQTGTRSTTSSYRGTSSSSSRGSGSRSTPTGGSSANQAANNFFDFYRGLIQSADKATVLDALDKAGVNPIGKQGVSAATYERALQVAKDALDQRNKQQGRGTPFTYEFYQPTAQDVALLQRGISPDRGTGLPGNRTAQTAQTAQTTTTARTSGLPGNRYPTSKKKAA